MKLNNQQKKKKILFGSELLSKGVQKHTKEILIQNCINKIVAVTYQYFVIV